eukprot:g10337.t2
MKAEIAAISKGLDVTVTAKKIWAASNGRNGFSAIAVKFNPIPDTDSERVLAIVFRSTKGLAEWLEYPVQSYNVPRDGGSEDGTQRVFKVWNRTLDEIWRKPLLPDLSGSNTLRRIIWRHLNKGGRVWLVGHSKGGAVATTAATRLILGDSAQDDALPTRVRRPADPSPELSNALKRLSIFTFNAPKALNAPLAEEYDKKAKDNGIIHLRFETQGDTVVNLPPPWLRLKHVGVAMPKARDVVRTTGNRKVRVAKIVAGLVVAGGTLAIWSMRWAGLVGDRSVRSVWCVWGCFVIAVVFGLRKYAKLKEETQLRHVLSGNICAADGEEAQLLEGDCSYLRLLLVEYQERIGLLKRLHTTSTGDARSLSPEVETQFVQHIIRVNSVTKEMS